LDQCEIINEEMTFQLLFEERFNSLRASRQHLGSALIASDFLWP